MKWTLFFFSCLLFLKATAQLPISARITMPSAMPANISEWATAMPPVTIQAMVKPDSTRGIPDVVLDAKILVTIKAETGGKVCGSYTPKTAPNANITSLVKMYRGGEIEKLLGQSCTLKPGVYTLCVQFFADYNGQQKTLSEEAIKPFTVKGNEATSYTPPQNLQPADGKTFTEKESKTPLSFSWVPLLPRPQGETTYRLKVWQIKEGQAATQVIKSEQPVLEKEIKNQTQYMVTQGWPGKVMGSYVWNVEAVNMDGKVLGGSLPTVFAYSSGGNHNVSDAKIDSITCIDYNHVRICGKYICKQSGWGSDGGYTLFPTQINTATVIAMPSNTTVGTLTALGTVNEGGTIPICINTLAIPQGTTSLSLNFDGKVLDPQHTNMNQMSTADTTKPNCNCTPCDQNNVRLTNISSGYYQDIVSVVNRIGASPNKISKIQADLVFVRVTPKINNCVQCNKKTVQQGNFTELCQITQGNVTLWKDLGRPTYLGENSIPNSARSIVFIANAATGVDISAGINIKNTIGLTPISCCGDEVEIWVRYTVWDVNCHACDKLVKTTLQRAGSCNAAPTVNNTDNQPKN